MRPESGAATALVMAWAALLTVLAVLWVRSPFLGVGTAFVAWSGPAAVVCAVSWRWLRAWNVEQIPLSRLLLALLIVGWIATLALSVTDVGPRLALDGLIMRREGLRLLGRGLVWLPLVYGLGLSVAGLAASLEARYRIVNAPETRSTGQVAGR